MIGSKEEWYLTHIDRSVNNDTQVLLDGSDSSYAMWRNTNDTLRKHLGDLHYRTNKKGVEGIWAHYTGGKFAGSGLTAAIICISLVTIKQIMPRAHMVLH